jgi:hypothetical protein
MQVPLGFVLREVRQVFTDTIAQMQRMHPEFEVKPRDVSVIKAMGASGELTLECSPVVCRVPERASHGKAGLYVVFTGLISFLPEQDEKRLVTSRYGTNFAYFTVSPDGAEHVLGGHYDLSESHVSHPHTHLQLRSQADLYGHASS